ncbi:putative aerobactin siderophore biosynthesis protein iucb protein [Phaeoacremonium minimum UCRPA7]|uniref:Putative aerobactin siderophore biosynthesis protein iucb protein n=1 Tax=Phaeoacremonium minimum (strain UCR-PA7) TaxID=1286976 RepID=R8BSN4_PHAM7|nr:putative aerobactin siderophore biosynthesis protein iucb protein [Phaeoacremonium minimum UCRPA7]EOO02377.1 putative aerobactin siderophore biosynthesis protein iucb protein [Phaeoacremonium minimum UCRPA7]
MARISLADWPTTEPFLKLPHPYLTPYLVFQSSKSHPEIPEAKLFQLRVGQQDASRTTPPQPLHNEKLYFTEPQDLKSSDRPADSNNTAWARARRSPSVTILWDDATPSLGQVWLLSYILFTVRADEEFIRLRLVGEGKDIIATQLKTVMLAVNHPLGDSHTGLPDELILIRSTFWQGAGSPFGSRPIWLPEDNAAGLSSLPPAPLDYIMTNNPQTALCWHPRRAAKPRPGSVIYSRYIPHLKETFSMIALDYENPEHLALFHQWQNDPRVSQGWNETGTLEQHREYLRKIHDDPHQFTVLAAFDDTLFAYFEIYWGKEDRLGAYYPANDFDRGRHSLVGDIRYRGQHRVGAWWSSQMHYLFLDDPRTMYIVGEPKFTNSIVLTYDLMHGFSIDKFVDLPHKRSGLMKCSKERFFQICPLGEDSGGKVKVVGGTGIGLVPKL